METEVHSPANTTFISNLSRLKGLLKALRVDSKELDAELVRSKATGDSQRISALERRVARRNANLAFVFEWHCAMLVTFAETYLQDVLVFFSGLDTQLLNDSEQKASYGDIQASRSLDDLAEQLRIRWARSWVDKGGPALWINRLQRMGASSYPKELAEQLEELWGIRHVIIHRAGLVTLDFCRRHPQFGLAPGEPIQLTQDRVARYTDAVSQFVSITDSYFANRYRGLLKDKQAN
ncbi:hypothetical protein [Archangium sp.]|jgi:hypothetical protein|uniref:hypothetical protein n=1 Tax=Archangium sp. TaxID=1872627 RepID=UPI002ED92F50